MKTITKYVSIDGCEFHDLAKCERRDKLCEATDAIMSKLPPLPQNDGCAFANGGGYIQHDPAIFTEVRRALLNLALPYFKDESPLKKWVTDAIDGNVHASWPARAFDEYGLNPISKAWHRVYCTTADFREFGQPYYAANPDEAEQRRLNP